MSAPTIPVETDESTFPFFGFIVGSSSLLELTFVPNPSPPSTKLVKTQTKNTFSPFIYLPRSIRSNSPYELRINIIFFSLTRTRFSSFCLRLGDVPGLAAAQEVRPDGGASPNQLRRLSRAVRQISGIRT